jgi:cob(I)alamin adenosyltransferase
VSKDSLLIKAQGDLDELNANIACVLAHSVSPQIESILLAVQHHLFNIGGELSAPQFSLCSHADVDWLEQWIDHFNASLPALKEFILPGGDAAVAHCHVARTVCRRAERSLIECSHEKTLRNELIQYINRLSDLLFVIGRVIERDAQSTPTYWKKDLHLPKPPNANN